MLEDNLTHSHIEILQQGLKQLKIPFSDKEILKLQNFYKIYQEENRKINLSRILEPQEFIIKHILDSAAGLPFFKNALHIMDIGAGGGFPGLVLAVLAPQIQFVLVDVIAKKVQYLKKTIELLKLKNCIAINASQEKVPQYTDYITCRALGSLEKIVQISLKYGLKQTPIIAYKAKKETILEELFFIDPKLKPEIIFNAVPYLEAERHLVIYQTSIK